MKKMLLMFAVMLGVAGGVGWWYGVNHGSPKTGRDDSGKVASENQEPVSDNSDGMFFTIQEWNVRFLLPAELQGDLIAQRSDAEHSGTIMFASKRLNTLLGDASCDLVKQPDGGYGGGIQASLVRVDPRQYPVDSLEAYKQQLTFIKELGDYEYYARKQLHDPPVTCLTGGKEEFNTVEQDISGRLMQAFKDLETID